MKLFIFILLTFSILNPALVYSSCEEAFGPLTLAADQGHASAQYALALSYYLGDGVKKDYKKAFDLCKKAAEQGHVLAQKHLQIFDYMLKSSELDL